MRAYYIYTHTQKGGPTHSDPARRVVGDAECPLTADPRASAETMGLTGSGRTLGNRVLGPTEPGPNGCAQANPPFLDLLIHVYVYMSMSICLYSYTQTYIYI